MTTINITADKTTIDKTRLMLRGLGEYYSPVMTRAINKTLTTVRAKAVDEIYVELNLTKTLIRSSFSFGRATYSAPKGHVLSASRPVPLISFSGTRALARGGVSIQIKRGGVRTVLKHAFIATMKSGHKGVFERSGGNLGKPYNILKNYAAMPKKYRLPIDELYSLRITDEYAKPAILNSVLNTAGDTYEKNIAHELDYELSKLNV